ncbi:hypothetical protein GW17_00027190 [Ensete ventricosum]|nr:hypothetical protein GW17_00027190 [Ensete ventricosum]RZR92300.1 hypothetical protein BHM03_00020576 [Ensete ventricosum]
MVDKALTVSVLDEVIEGVAVAVIGELVVASGELLQALGGDAVEVAAELGVLRQDHRAPRDEAVDQRLLSHLPSPEETLIQDPRKRNGGCRSRRGWRERSPLVERGNDKARD